MDRVGFPDTTPFTSAKILTWNLLAGVVTKASPGRVANEIFPEDPILGQKFKQSSQVFGGWFCTPTFLKMPPIGAGIMITFWDGFKVRLLENHGRSESYKQLS